MKVLLNSFGLKSKGVFVIKQRAEKAKNGLHNSKILVIRGKKPLSQSQIL